ncbi:MAG: GtrA family protein [Alphaproteobacteria bacterium]|nr:MAG: GtrA family protein [Alphaproteobacteria bacterium]
MRRVLAYVLIRHRSNWTLLGRFGLAGGSGVLVNMLVLFIAKKLGPFHGAVLADLPGTTYNIRWYHLYLTVAFLVANLYNFQLNRTWTFRSAKHARWVEEYWPFLCVGLAAFAVGLTLATLLIHPNTPLSLPAALDDSTGFRDRSYWANLIQIAVTVPLAFTLNKLWTFSSVRSGPTLVPIVEQEELDAHL